MKTAYIEMIGGASGNMLLGALIDAGADAVAIERALQTIPVSGWAMERSRVVKCGIAATYVDFDIPGEDCRPGEQQSHDRHLHDILAIIDHSALSMPVRTRARAMYTKLAQAEAHVHGTSVEEIHFHEVGQVDAILDVAGVCIALELLGIEEVTCSAYPIGRGSISMHHGHYPNPPPATSELMRGAPTIATDVDGEMVTTTAAAILATLVERPGVRPNMTFDRIGYGAGRADFLIPNVTRIVIGESAVSSSTDDPDTDDVSVIETNIDDMSPQDFALAIERLFAAGALDVWTTSIGMKKNRPAIMLSAITAPEKAQACARVMLEQTTTLGVRMRTENRLVLPRESRTLMTPLGEVRVKIAQIGDTTRTTPEHDDIVRIAREREMPIAAVVRELHAFLEGLQTA
jgi:pyridinium-3,5-bisthiocarboxylic acid mononucleotide nickel chelatase